MVGTGLQCSSVPHLMGKKVQPPAQREPCFILRCWGKLRLCWSSCWGTGALHCLLSLLSQHRDRAPSPAELQLWAGGKGVAGARVTPLSPHPSAVSTG